MAAQGLSMHGGSKTCQLVPTLPLSGHCQRQHLAAQLPSCSSTIQLTHAAQAVISPATASELPAVAHRRSGETLEYLQTMYRVRLDQHTTPSLIPRFSQ